MPLCRLLRLTTATALATVGLPVMSLRPDGSTLMYGLEQLEMELWIMDPPDFAPSPGGRP
ncbi:MAG: hypothetical protein ABR551_04305 [Gemmatimonadales bacterium]